MTQEDKEILLKYLCMALPYEVIIEYNNDSCVETREMGLGSLHDFIVDNAEVKPYLRPMSSMTEEEKKIIRSYGFELIFYDTCYTGFANTENCIDEVSFRFMEEFLNAHHFDYHGLIEKGLAIEAPKDMYNIK